MSGFARTVVFAQERRPMPAQFAEKEWLDIEHRTFDGLDDKHRAYKCKCDEYPRFDTCSRPAVPGWNITEGELLVKRVMLLELISIFKRAHKIFAMIESQVEQEILERQHQGDGAVSIGSIVESSAEGSRQWNGMPGV